MKPISEEMKVERKLRSYGSNLRGKTLSSVNSESAGSIDNFCQGMVPDAVRKLSSDAQKVTVTFLNSQEITDYEMLAYITREDLDRAFMRAPEDFKLGHIACVILLWQFAQDRRKLKLGLRGKTSVLQASALEVRTTALEKHKWQQVLV